MAGSSRIANRSVWQFISGTGILRPKELVSYELKENQNKITEGLLYYKKPKKNVDKLKKERKVPEQQIDFVQKLSLFLGLDEVQTYDLFCSYLTHEYRSSEKNLKSLPRSGEAIIAKRHMKMALCLTCVNARPNSQQFILDHSLPRSGKAIIAKRHMKMALCLTCVNARPNTQQFILDHSLPRSGKAIIAKRHMKMALCLTCVNARPNTQQFILDHRSGKAIIAKRHMKMALCLTCVNARPNTQQFILDHSNDQHTKGLILKIQEYYFSERLYLTCCLKYIMSNGQEMSKHPYQDVYEEFFGSLQTNDKLIKSLENQHNALCDADIPTWETHGTLMNKKHSIIWAVQNLKEQCEILECLLISFGDLVECDLAKFTALLKKFKSQGFGRWQKFQHLLDETSEKYLKKIQFLEIIIVLKCLDFDLIQMAAKNKSFEHHPLFKDEESFKELDKIFCRLSSLPTHGPLLLGWAAARSFYMDGEDERTTRKLGSQALQLDALNTICTLLKYPHFSGYNVVSSVTYCTVYTLVCALLDQFQEETIGGITVLCSVISQLLSKPSITEDMWSQGLDEGVGSFYQLAKDEFPYKFSPLIQLSTTLAAAGKSSALKVMSTLKSLPTYLENFDRSISAEYQQMDEMTLCQLNKDRRPYISGNFIIPVGTYGHQHLESATKGGHLVQWVFTYNCWTVLTCEIQDLIFHVSRSPNMITADQTVKASQVFSLVKSVLSNVPDSIDQFQDILDLCYQVIHRFSGLTTPPLDLIAVCVETLTQVAKKHPHKVWQNMKQTGLLPYFTEHLGNADVFSSKGLRPGMYGSFLAGFECPQGRYPLSLAFLDFISTVVMDLSEVPVDNEISATVLFILTEVFPSFYKWRYYNATRREAIGHKCLEIFHKILDVMAKPKVVSKRKLPNLQNICVHNLLYTEAGQSLLNVISIGVDTFNNTMTEQCGFFENKSAELIDLILISFSVLNRLLLLKSPELPVSPVERALSLPAASQQEQHIVLTVAQYIYHQHSPKLPTMAILLLKRLAVVSPMSILAILGNDAEPIKNKMLSRLSAVTEDLQLKVAILELLSVCVVTQPGLIELFLNLKLEKPNKDGKKELFLGNSSCLNTVMNLIKSEKQKTYQCPPNLLCASIEFLHALWSGMRETAMSVLRKIPYFWPSICEPLKRNIGDEKDDSEETQLSCLADIKIVAFVFMILANEIYSVPKDKLEESFKSEMIALSKQNRLQYWSKFIKKSLIETAKKENMDSYLTTDSLKDDPILLLLRSWKNWIITVTKLKIPGVALGEDLKAQILSDLLSSIQSLVKENMSVYNLKLACIASATYFTIMTSWVSSMKKWMQVLEELQLVLDMSFSNKECLIPAVQIGLVASLTTLLQLSNQEHVNISDECLISLLRLVCSMLLECVRNLFPTERKVKVSEEADSSNSVVVLQGKQQTRIKLVMTSILLLQEIILHLDRPNLWIPILHNHLLIPTLLTTVQIWIKAKQGLPFVDSALTLLLTISKTEQGAKILMSTEVANHLCLSISSLYGPDDIQHKLLSTNWERNVPEHQTWDNVLCLSIDLYASMLATLKYSFLKEALDFIGVHQDRLLQSLELARINLTEPVLKEAHATCRFIYQMSFYAHDWKFHLPKVLSKIMTSLVYMCQTFISLLVRPRYLQHFLEHSGSTREDIDGKRPTQLVTPLSAFLQHSSHDDSEQPSAQCLKVKKNILSIIGICLSSLRQFTPDLCEMLMDQSMDISRYDPFLAIGFNAPSVDQEAQPTFGTLLACINMCMTFLSKLDPRAASPQKGNEVSGQVIPKNLVLFVLENSLLLIMSQACRYLKEPSLSAREKQLLKRELSADLNTFLQSMHRHMRKGTTTPVSPCGPNVGGQQSSTSPTGNFSMIRGTSQTGFPSNFDQGFYRLVSEFVTKVLR